MKLRYKIISYSSQDNLAPITNLISGSGIWQSSRFCEYPQQITIQFYQAVTISSIHIVSHPSKISQKINILFYMPDKNRDRDRDRSNNNIKFQKYGYIQFNDNTNTEHKLRQLKKIEQINQNALYMRLILWKNYQNSHNFFNQVGLSQLTIYGDPCSTNINILPPVIANKSGLINISINEYIQNKLEILEQFKQQFSNHDDFQGAKQVKQIIKVIKLHGEKLKILDNDKKNAVGKQQYQKAKQIKAQMEDLRKDIEYVANNFYDPNKKIIKPVLKQTKLKVKFDEIMSNSGNFNANDSRITNKLKKVKMQVLGEQKQVVSDQQPEREQQGERQLGSRQRQRQRQRQRGQKQKQYQQNQQQNQQQQQQQQVLQMSKSKISHDNRIIPTILKKNKRSYKSLLQGSQIIDDAALEDNQFIEKNTKNQQDILLEQMTPSAQANAAVLIEMYQKQIVKKLHSKHWNFKIEALNMILQDMKKWLGSAQQLEKNRIKAVLFTFNKCIKQGNFQIYITNLDLLSELVSSKKPAYKTAQTDLQSQLQKSINQLFLKMGDSQKIKQKCQQIITKMMSSDLYGPIFLYQAIHRSYFNQGLTHNLKIKKHKLGVVESILQKFGIGNKDGLPMGAVDFMCKVAEDTNQQIRKQATSILKQMKQKGAANKVKQTVRSKASLKGSIIKQLEG